MDGSVLMSNRTTPDGTTGARIKWTSPSTLAVAPVVEAEAEVLQKKVASLLRPIIYAPIRRIGQAKVRLALATAGGDEVLVTDNWYATMHFHGGTILDACDYFN
jgi:hypothetical protein